MIASYRSDAEGLLEELQRAGIVQVLDAERAMVSKEWPELHVEAARPRDIEELVSRLAAGIDFLKQHATEKDATSIFDPLLKVDAAEYAKIIGGDEAIKLLEETEAVQSEIAQCGSDMENAEGHLAKLEPWTDMTGALEDMAGLEQASCLVGLVPNQHIAAISAELAEMGAAVEIVGGAASVKACVIACMTELAGDVQKKLRTVDFEAVSFEGIGGSIADNIAETQGHIQQINSDLAAAKAKAVELAKDKIKLQILFDHRQNLLGRETAKSSAPATDNVIFIEGWAKEKDYKKLEKIVGKFGASSVSKIDMAEGEESPVEIDNGKMAQPFELITRLYGMPNAKDLDPTAFLAPFFAMFFGICLTDAAYGLIMIAILWWAIRKMKGNKGVLWMFMMCAISTVIAGALTGGWFGDAVFVFAGEGSWLDNLRTSIMLFDPMTQPMVFFGLALGIGYIQIMFGICLALYNNLRQKDYASAIFEQVTWLILLNSLALVGVCKAGLLPDWLAKVFGGLAIIQAVLIFFFTERKSGLGGRIGGGVFALFNTVFYFGDILSYVRLMALGMVTAGLGMAVNILVGLLMDIPVVGWFLGAVLFVVGHLFNLAMSTLSSFVHSLRLQFVEFFPKFLTGGGRDFEPLHETYKHVSVTDNN
jgi:V/A-type H+-transporting ATPase subunit I